MFRPLALVPLLAVALAVGGCGAADGPRDDGRLRVVAGFYPLAEAAARVGGDLVDVQNLTPPGGEPHDLEVTTRDVDRLEDADLVVYLGGGFQPGIEDVVGRGDGATVDVADEVGLDHGDPHFWLDPTRLVEAVDAVATALADAAPGDARTFRRNAAAYRKELLSLDAELDRGLATCRRKQLVTAHAAFGYLADRYGLDQRAITGLSPEAEATPDRLADLAEQIEAAGVTTVFTETLVSPEVAEVLAREAGVRTAVLDPIEGLTDAQLRAGATYGDVMRENLRTLRTALDCR
jgi:zinc transport system substrate-binding protein